MTNLSLTQINPALNLMTEFGKRSPGSPAKAYSFTRLASDQTDGD